MYPIYYISRAVLFTVSMNCVSNTNIAINKNCTSKYKQHLTTTPVVCLESSCSEGKKKYTLNQKTHFEVSTNIS